MIASSLTDAHIPTLDSQMTVSQARELMERSRLFHLPMVKEKAYAGVYSFDVLDGMTPSRLLATVDPLKCSTVLPNTHFFEIWSRMVEDRISGIAVVDADGTYVGFIRQEILIQLYAKSFALTEPGCILILSMRKSDYSMQRIAALVEEHGYHILSSFVMEKTEKSDLLITLKLNAVDPNRLINTFDRFEIEIEGIFSENEFSDILQDRYEQLMNYLNV